MHAGVSRALELVVLALLARGCDQFQVRWLAACVGLNLQEAGPATEPIDPQEAVAGTALAQHFQDALRPGYAPRTFFPRGSRLTGQRRKSGVCSR